MWNKATESGGDSASHGTLGGTVVVCTSDDKFHSATASTHNPNQPLTVGGVETLLRSHDAKK